MNNFKSSILINYFGSITEMDQAPPMTLDM